MSDTPRTDGQRKMHHRTEVHTGSRHHHEYVLSWFARQLERELSAAKALAESNGKLAHDRGIELMQSKEANAGLMKACKHLESEIKKQTTSEPLRTAYSLKEISEKLNQWMIDLWTESLDDPRGGEIPKSLTQYERDQFYRDNGLIYHFLADHFPTEKQNKQP
jgi:hypothetical protein